MEKKTVAKRKNPVTPSVSSETLPPILEESFLKEISILLRKPVQKIKKKLPPMKPFTFPLPSGNDYPKFVLIPKGLPIYRIEKDAIYLCTIDQYKSFSYYLHIFFHEMAHATGHEKRIGRFAIYKDHLLPKSCEEMIADLAAGLMLSRYGKMNRVRLNNIAYSIQSYIGPRLNQVPKWDDTTEKLCFDEARKAASWLQRLDIWAQECSISEPCNVSCVSNDLGKSPSATTQAIK